MSSSALSSPRTPIMDSNRSSAPKPRTPGIGKALAYPQVHKGHPINKRSISRPSPLKAFKPLPKTPRSAIPAPRIRTTNPTTSGAAVRTLNIELKSQSSQDSLGPPVPPKDTAVTLPAPVSNVSQRPMFAGNQGSAAALAPPTTIQPSDLESQVVNPKKRKYDLDKWVKISSITRNSLCSLLAVALLCLVISLVVLVLRSEPKIVEILKKGAQIADGFGPQ